MTAIAGLSPEILCSEPVVGTWTVKDIFGHIVSWDEEFRGSIEMIRQGKHPGYEHQIRGDDDFNGWNQVRISQKRIWPWERIWRDFERDYWEATELILDLEPADFRKRGVTPWKQAAVKRPETLTKTDTESIETLITYHWRHSNQHAGMIERWRKRREKKLS
jgi:hypothetical protein